MNEEDNKPTYGELYVENFRLEHNYRVVLEREAKLQNNWNELKNWCKENQYNDNFDSYQVDNYTTYNDILNKIQELEGNNES